MEHTTQWHLEQYHTWGALVYDGPYEARPVDPYLFSIPGFVNDLIEYLYCQEMLQVLTKQQREMIQMRIDGYEQKDIAKEYGCSRDSVNQVLVKARKRLRNTSLMRRS